MTDSDIRIFRQWFSDFCESFHTDNVEDQKNISMKEFHTLKVCENMQHIVRGLGLESNMTLIAEAVALFHDVGRFPQYQKYKTFRDSESVNHGALGSETLISSSVLNNLADNERELIIKAVRFHNAFAVPVNEDNISVLFIKLVRDADKLDIWRVFLDYFESPEISRANAITLGLPDIPEYSAEVISHIYRKETAPHLKVKTVNDFKLLQLSWVFDLNFPPSFELMKERNYVDRLISHLPQTDEIKNVCSFINEFIRNYKL